MSRFDVRSGHARRALALSVLAAAVLVAGCGQEAAPQPVPLPDEVTFASVGRYCGMTLADHEGPKGQIHLQGQAEPVWFSSVRDTIAFTRLPEEPRDIAAIYVNDMGRAKNWAQPEPGTWIDARKAWFVIDSDARGGMGAPEAVPFSDQAAAEAFQAQHRGRVVRLADVPDRYVLGPVDLVLPAPAASSASAARHSAGH
ncbi:MAG TPA: nitrous oxide reductase accessory protein NosL [Burkholderiaceae bacterium]|jgi:copper chaperone NosL|nr:nitrous oxide reductase accessory protein NosL [Burkholderiaceae bacterium]